MAPPNNNNYVKGRMNGIRVNYLTLGRMVKARRQHLGLNQGEVGTATATSGSTISRLESGLKGNASGLTIEAYAKVCFWLGVPMEQFVAGRPKLKADTLTDIGATLLADRALSEQARNTLLAIIRVGYSGVQDVARGRARRPRKGAK